MKQSLQTIIIAGLTAGALALGVGHAGAADNHCDGINPSRVRYVASETAYAASIHRDYLAHPESMNATVGLADWQQHWADVHGDAAGSLILLLRGCQ